jgi:anti-anti-sigma factor
MEYSFTKQQKACLAYVSGRLDAANSQELEEKLMKDIEANQSSVVADFSGLEYISSSGLRVLLVVMKKLTASGNKLILCGLRENIKEIFEISGFIDIFTIYANQDEALNSL